MTNAIGAPDWGLKWAIAKKNVYVCKLFVDNIRFY